MNFSTINALRSPVVKKRAELYSELAFPKHIWWQKSSPLGYLLNFLRSTAVPRSGLLMGQPGAGGSVVSKSCSLVREDFLNPYIFMPLNFHLQQNCH